MKTAAGPTATVTADTMALIWLTDHSRAAEVGALLNANLAAIGGGNVYVGSDIDALVDGQMAGLCDHGGLREQDRHVAMVIAGGKFHPGSTVDQPVTLQPPAGR